MIRFLLLRLVNRFAIVVDNALTEWFPSPTPDAVEWARIDHPADDPSETPLYDAMAKALFGDQLADDDLCAEYLEAWS